MSAVLIRLYKELVTAIYEASKLEFCVSSPTEAELNSSDLIKLTYMEEAFIHCAGQASCLTSLDLKFDNIMIKPIAPNKNNTTDYEVIFIDWHV
jgi:hypothetical protein